MKSKEAKAQLEVWDWKQKAYEEVKNMSLHDAIAYILSKTASTVADLKKISGKPTKPNLK